MVAGLAVGTAPVSWLSCYLTRAALIMTKHKGQDGDVLLSFKVDPCQGAQELSVLLTAVWPPFRAVSFQGHQASALSYSMAFITDCAPAERNGGLWILRANMGSGKVNWLSVIHRAGSDGLDVTCGLHSHTPPPESSSSPEQILGCI